MPDTSAPVPAEGGGSTSKASGQDTPYTEPMGKWLSLLLGALAAAFAFLGIEGDEVSTILRNQRWEASVIALLLAAALAMSAASFFVGTLRMPLRVAVASVLVTLAIIPAMIHTIHTGTRSDWAHHASRWVAVGLVALAAVIVVCHPVYAKSRSPSSWVRARPPAQLVVLLVGGVLLAAAVYSGLRLETRSQYRSTHPQVSVSYETSDGPTKVTLAVEAERLRSDDEVALRARQLPRRSGADADKQCAEDLNKRNDVTAPDRLALCSEQPCEVLVAACRFVAGAQLRPDAFGKIDDTFEFPVDPQSAEHVSIEAVLCIGDDQDEPPFEGLARYVRASGLTDTGAPEGCPPERTRRTTLDVRIPNSDN